MITPEIREELKQVQVELKKVFPAPQHEVRDLPGGQRKWVYLKWQTIRERLDDVCPDWIIDYSEIQYLGNDAICRCGITILGVRKEAIASVPLSIVSSKGNEMTRGSAADRLAAEALKNSAEVWGVGRYLDDQEFTIRYLWEHRAELDEQMQGELRRLSEQYKVQTTGARTQARPKNETGFLHAIAGTNPEMTITEGQRKRLWAIAKSELKLSDEQIKGAIKHFGFEKTELITRDKYEPLIQHLQSLVKADLYPANNEAIKKIRAVTKHEPDWIFAQCRHYGYERPGMMPKEILEKLITDMCVDWAYLLKLVSSPQDAHQSVSGAIEFAKGSGQPIVEAVLQWLARYQSSVPA